MEHEFEYELNQIEKEVTLYGVDSARLQAILGIPEDAESIVVFSHGSGSSRFSHRNNFVARYLQKYGYATLLVDLLSEREAAEQSFVFDIDLLAKRLSLIKFWLKKNPLTRKFQVGYFGSSTGASAAFVAAAEDPDDVFAIVSRGGRPDLAEDSLLKVKAPSFLIVGENDKEVIDINRRALKILSCTKALDIIPGATHLFEEDGALEQMADLATKWFNKHAKHEKDLSTDPSIMF